MGVGAALVICRQRGHRWLLFACGVVGFVPGGARVACRVRRYAESRRRLHPGLLLARRWKLGCLRVLLPLLGIGICRRGWHLVLVACCVHGGRLPQNGAWRLGGVCVERRARKRAVVVDDVVGAAVPCELPGGQSGRISCQRSSGWRRARVALGALQLLRLCGRRARLRQW